MKTRHILLSLTLLLTPCCPAVSQSADIRQGLIAYWPMEGTDGVTAFDATTFANHLTLVGMSAGNFVAGKYGNAASLTGSGTYMTNLHSPENYPVSGLPIYWAGRYTVCFWVKGAAQTAKYLFSEGNITTNSTLFILQTGQAATNNGKFDVIIRTDGNTALLNHVVSSNVVFDGTWHHIAWVDEQGRAKLYVDGNPDPANFNYTPAGTFTFHTTALGTLVRAAVATGAVFNGLMDDVAVWERALSQAEIQYVLYNSLATPVPELPPYIDIGPTNATRGVGDRVTFAVRAVGNRPLNYQWYFGADPILDANAPSLTLSNLTAAESGNYSVEVQNLDGIAAATAALTVVPDPEPDVRAGLISYWPFETQNADGLGATTTPDLYSHNDMALVNMDAMNEVPGMSGIAYSFDGAAEYTYRVGGFPIYNNPGYSISLWVNANGIGQGDRRIFSESSTNNVTPLFGFGTQASGANGSLRVYIRSDGNVVVLDRASTRPVLDGAWHHVAWTETNGQGRLYIDGELDATDFTYARTNLTLNQTSLGAILRATVGSYLAGSLDEVALWNRVLSFTEIQQIRTEGIPAPVADLPPTITQDPVSQSVLTRSKVTFSFLASGTSPLLPQWRKAGVDLLDQTNATLLLNGVTLGDAGGYDVVVANSAGRATSQVATLTVALRPPPPSELAIDFNHIGGETNTADGFASFVLPAFGAAPVRQVFGGAEVVLSGVNVVIESRLRTTPSNYLDFTEEKLLQDFVFARDATTSDGMDIGIEFLEPNRVYAVTLWSFDSVSGGSSRISDWSANGALVKTAYAFIGSDLPASNDRYRFSFDTAADAEGNILIQGRRSSSAAGGINVFLNALKVTRREVRVQKIEVISGTEVRLTIETINPASAHHVEQKTALDDAWSPVPDQDITWEGPASQILTATFSVPGATTRFYRVVEGP